MKKWIHTKIAHRILLVSIDVLSSVCCIAFAYLITNGFTKPTRDFYFWATASICLSLFLLYVFKMYSVVFSAVGIPDVLRILVAVLWLIACNLIFAFATDENTIDFSTIFIYALSFFYCACFSRFYKRIWRIMRYFTRPHTGKKRVMIIGAGQAGAEILREILTGENFPYYPVCLVDDDKEKQGKFVLGVKVAGTTEDILSLASSYDVKEIFITMPSVTKKRRSEITKICQECKIPVKILPGLYQIANGKATVSSLREVGINDLLGRDPVSVNLDETLAYIENKTVLVTGGGGSIGSELCRQIALHNPKKLIVLDIYENNAYDIEQELKRTHPTLNLLTLIANVREEKKIREVFKAERPQIVFHAAAHKHVPLMETSPNEAVKNNVFGTLNVARCADEFEAETFVMISTDKAVNPTNIMGATKRICEMIVQTIGKHSQRTKFVAVRFGNVLGSNGSVIPLFKKQIAAGGPVTVTHKDIIRYFMTIPEAVSLVIQAGAYAKGGEIYVLDMGEPVKIYDLAYNLIKLSGFEPNVDIEIVCTGLRPGEKLYEERLMSEEGLQKTENGLISIAKPIPLNETALWEALEKLKGEAYGEKDDMRMLVRELVPTYRYEPPTGVKLEIHA